MEMLLMLIAITFDTCIMSVAYSMNGMKITTLSKIIISMCGALLLFFALLFSKILARYIDPDYFSWLGILILAILGCISIVRSVLTKKGYVISNNVKNTKHLNSVFHIYMDQKQADFDCSKTITIQESVYLGLAMSLDSVASGIGYGTGSINVQLCVTLSAILCFFSICIGEWFGKKIQVKYENKVQWIPGGILLLIAMLRIKTLIQ